MWDVERDTSTETSLYIVTMRGQGMPVFAGASYQRGHGVGRVMKNLMRHATPLLKKAGKRALKAGVSTIINDIAKTKGKKKQPQRKTSTRVRKTTIKKPRKRTQTVDIFSNK